MLQHFSHIILGLEPLNPMKKSERCKCIYILVSTCSIVVLKYENDLKRVFESLRNFAEFSEQFANVCEKIHIFSNSGVSFCASRKMLQNEYLIAKIGADTAENEPPKGLRRVFDGGRGAARHARRAVPAPNAAGELRQPRGGDAHAEQGADRRCRRRAVHNEKMTSSGSIRHF